MTQTPPPNFTAGLKAFKTDALPKPFGGTYSTKRHGQAVMLDGGIRTLTTAKRTADATQAASMREAIGSLPDAGESIHLWIGGHHSMGHVLPVVLDLADDAGGAEVHLATLTYSKDNAARWAELIDAGKIAKLTIITSVYFTNTNADIWEYSKGLLLSRGVQIHAVRCHCKLMAVRFGGGRTVTAEGSANTRSAKTCEQVTLFGSPDVYRFHVDQMTRAATYGTDGSGRIKKPKP